MPGGGEQGVRTRYRVGLRSDGRPKRTVSVTVVLGRVWGLGWEWTVGMDLGL